MTLILGDLMRSFSMESIATTLGVLTKATWFAWFFALLLLALKLTDSKVDAWTSYGKLSKKVSQRSNNSASHGMLRLAMKLTLDFSVSHRFAFTSGYVVGSIATFIVICFATYFYYATGWSYIDWHSIAPIYVVLGLYGFHLLRRIYECFFVHAFSHRLMPLHNYALILAYYLAVPVSVGLEMVFFTVKSPELTELWIFGANAWLLLPPVCVLYFLGQLHQHRAHVILAQLRISRNRPSSPPTSPRRGVSERRSVYAVPHGDWFEYVSSPHYLSEIMTYSSFVGFTRGRVVSLWLIFMFVCVTLTHQALQTHRWYKSDSQFRPGDVPKKRKVLLPFLY